VLGGFLGVLLYGEAYPALSAFANGGALGPVKVYESLGVSRGGFVLFLIVAALAAFAATTWIERKVSPEASSWSFPRLPHRLAAAGLLALGIALFFLPDRRSSLLAQANDPAYQRSHPVRYMTSDELAFRVLDQDPRLVVLDLRDEESQKRLALPGSVSLPIDGIFAREWQGLLGRRHSTRVFVDEDGSRSVEGALLAERLGYENVRVLQGGLAELRRTILEHESTGAVGTAAERDTDRFRSEARVDLARMISDAKAHSTRPKKVVKKIQGGCS
jgi:rhodanese-related sulfurtransferase